MKDAVGPRRSGIIRDARCADSALPAPAAAAQRCMKCRIWTRCASGPPRGGQTDTKSIYSWEAHVFASNRIDADRECFSSAFLEISVFRPPPPHPPPLSVLRSPVTNLRVPSELVPLCTQFRLADLHATERRAQPTRDTGPLLRPARRALGPRRQRLSASSHITRLHRAPVFVAVLCIATSNRVRLFDSNTRSTRSRTRLPGRTPDTRQRTPLNEPRRPPPAPVPVVPALRWTPAFACESSPAACTCARPSMHTR